MNREKLHEAIHMMITTDRMHKRLFDTKLCDIGIHRSAHIILINIHIIICIKIKNLSDI